MRARARLPFAAALAASFASAGACGNATGPAAALPQAGAPRALAYSGGDFGGALTSVRMAGDTVVLVRRPFFAPADSAVRRRVPSAEEWRAFWEAADAAGVGRWPAACADPSVADGGGFAFELAWAGGRRAGTYSNAYPTREGGCRRDPQVTAAAATFQEALFAMAGIVID
jgi:hypothetical protein